METTKREIIDANVATMKRDRAPYEPHWSMVGQYALPYRLRMNITDQNRGDRRNLSIIDSTVGICLRTIKAGMMNGHTNPADRWFRYRLKDRELSEFGPVKEWLDQENIDTLQDFDRSNLYSCLPLVYGDTSGFATSTMSIEEDLDAAIFGRVHHIGTYWFSTNHKNELDSWYREFRMTIRQLMKRFATGAKDLSMFSSQVRKMIDDRTKWNEWVDVGQIIMPNTDYLPDRLASKYKPIGQCWFELGVSKASGNANYLEERDRSVYLEENGFDEMPILLSRWEAGEGDTWGLDSPGMMSIGDAKSLQMGERRIYQAIDKLVDPHYLVPASVEEANSNLDFLPGEYTVVDDSDGLKGMRPIYEINPRVQEQEAKQEQLRQRIKTVHYYDLFRMLDSLDDRTRTATEILERKAEKLNLLAPTTVQLAKGVLRPLIDRTFKIRWRQGRVADPPDELEGQEIEVEYMGVFAQAQRATQVQPIQQLLMQVAPFVQVRPDILDKIDLDQVIDELANALQVPAKIIREDSKVLDLRAARDKQAAIMRAAEVAQSAGKAAKDLSQAKTDNPNALTEMTKAVRGAA